MKEEQKRKISPWMLVAGILILFISGGLYTTSFFKEEVLQQQREKLATEIDLLVPFVTNDEKFSFISSELDEAISTDERITILDSAGKIIYDSSHQKEATGTREMRPEIQQILKDKQKIGYSVRESETVQEKYLYVAKPIQIKNRNVGIIRISEKYTGISSHLVQFQKQLFAVFFILAVAILVLYYVLLKQSRKPIQFILPILKDAIKNPNKKQKVVDAPSEWQVLYDTVYELMDETNSLYVRQKQDETKLQFLFENLEIGLFIVNSAGHLTLANEATERLFGKKFKECHYQEWFTQPKVIKLIQESMRTQEISQSEFQVAFQKSRDVKITVRPLRSDSDEIEYVGILYDVTEIRQIERVHEDFISNISHELKTPTTSIMGFAETLLSGAKDDPETTTEFLTIIEKESHRLMRLIQNILMLLKTEKDIYLLDQVSLSPKTVIEEEIERYRHQAQQKELTIIFDSVFDKKFKVPSNAFQLIVKNLIENAIEYSEKNGEIFVYLVEQNDMLIFTVEDTGIGVSDEDQARIFERFYRVSQSRQRNTGGSGLGLSIVQHYVSMLGGTVKLTSELGEGTTVIVKLPFTEEKGI